MSTPPSYSRFVAPILMLGLLSPAAARAGTQAVGPRVLVRFEHSENFILSTGGHAPDDAERNEILGMFRDFITQRATPYLSDGRCLYVTFVRIDLSAIGPTVEGVTSRHGELVGGTTIKGSPMFEFGWAITDRAGAVLRKGASRLVPYQLGLVELNGEAFRKDPHHFEKARLDEWMRDNLRPDPSI